MMRVYAVLVDLTNGWSAGLNVMLVCVAHSAEEAEGKSVKSALSSNEGCSVAQVCSIEVPREFMEAVLKQ